MNFINMKTDKKETETQKDEKGASRDDDYYGLSVVRLMIA